MSEALYISTIELPSLFFPKMSEALERALVPLDRSSKDDVVGIQIYISLDSDGCPLFAPMGEIIVNQGDRCWTRSWSMLAEDHPQRTAIAIAMAEITPLLDRLSVEEALEEMTTSDEREHFILNLFIKGAYIQRSDAMENVIEPLSWEENILEQSTIDSCFALIVPAFGSHHERLAANKPYQRIQDVIFQITPVSWHETDPVKFEFRFAADSE